MAEAIRFEKSDKLCNPIKRLKTPNPATARPPRKLHQAKRPRVEKSVDVPADEPDNFVISSDDNNDYEGITECTMSALESEDFSDSDWLDEYDTIEMLLRPSNAEVCCVTGFIHVLRLLTRYYLLDCRPFALEDSP